jgi:hypothetical protein
MSCRIPSAIKHSQDDGTIRRRQEWWSARGARQLPPGVERKNRAAVRSTDFDRLPSNDRLTMVVKNSDIILESAQSMWEQMKTVCVTHTKPGHPKWKSAIVCRQAMLPSSHHKVEHCCLERSWQPRRDFGEKWSFFAKYS